MNKLYIIPLILALAVSMVIAPTAVFAGNGDDDDDDNNNGNDLSKLSDEQQAFQQGQAFGKQQAQEEQQQAAAAADQQAKPDKPKKCQVKAQVKILNAVNGTIYTVQLDNLTPQGKLANNTDTVAFNFQYKKGDTCPVKGGVETGTVDGEQFAVVINSLTKPNKVAIDPAFDDQAAVDQQQQEINTQ